MKKIQNLLAAFVVAGLTLTSCSSDDNSSSAQVSIVGKWNQDKVTTKIGSGSTTTQRYQDNVAGCDKNYIEFVEGGVLKDVVYFKQAGECQENASNEARWSKDEDDLTISNAGNLSGDYDIVKLTNGALQIKSTTSSPSGDIVTTVFFVKAK